MTVVDLFRALGDPSRLEMVEKLANGESHTIGSLFKGMSITRQGARKHLQILTDAKLIVLEPKGRDTVVRLDRQMLDQGKSFIAELEYRWDERLEALLQFVENGEAEH
jgi:DNA-binding transcriptional ArsR family regulator